VDADKLATGISRLSSPIDRHYGPNQQRIETWALPDYVENRGYCLLGIGALVRNMMERMVAVIEGTVSTVNEIGGDNGE
jgi:hypothetical protein